MASTKAAPAANPFEETEVAVRPTNPTDEVRPAVDERVHYRRRHTAGRQACIVHDLDEDAPDCATPAIGVDDGYKLCGQHYASRPELRRAARRAY